jgi:hypothetical protein
MASKSPSSRSHPRVALAGLDSTVMQNVDRTNKVKSHIKAIRGCGTFCPSDAYGVLEADRAWVVVDTFSNERGSWDLSIEQRLVIERGPDGFYAIRDRIKDAWGEKGGPFVVWGIETMEDAELIRNHLVNRKPMR